MKVLLDTCVWGGVKTVLADLGHDVIWGGDWEKDPGDEAILELANKEDRVMVTLDKDFGELAVIGGKPHRGIVRLVGLSAKDQGTVCVSVLDRYGQELSNGAIVTVEPGRVRFRPADD